MEIRNIKPFGFRRNLDYIRECIIIQFKILNEYKTNFYSGLILCFLFTFSISTFLYIIYTNFNGLIGWGFNEYAFFVIFNAIIIISFASFSFAVNLSQILLSGKLNVYISKPLSTIWQYFSNGVSLFLIFNALAYIIMLIGLLIFKLNDISYMKLLVVIFFGIFAGILHVSIIRLLDSFAFFMKNNTMFLNIYFEFKGVFDNFPLSIFGKGFVYQIGLFWPNVYSGFFTTQYLFGYIGFVEFFQHFLCLFSLCIVCVSLILILWHYGLKRYEAFG